MGKYITSRYIYNRIFIIKPPRQFRMIAKRYPMIFKGFIASMVGCIVTLLVNDSGIVAASTASIYILIPLIIISMKIKRMIKEISHVST